MHFKRYFFLISLALGAVLATACQHEAVAPEVSFSRQVQPVLLANCTMSGCHGDVNTQEFKLLTYDDVQKQLEPGKADKSELYRVLIKSGSERMPMNLPPLSEPNIVLIHNWIDQGAKNN